MVDSKLCQTVVFAEPWLDGLPNMVEKTSIVKDLVRPVKLVAEKLNVSLLDARSTRRELSVANSDIL